MSASRDKDQKVKFVFPNLYEIHSKKQNDKKGSGGTQQLPTYSQVIKAEDLNRSHFAAVRINSYIPVEMIGKRVQKPSPLPFRPANQALESLKGNLKQLNELQARLRFMLKELEELVKE